MIGCTKLLCGTATVSEALRYEKSIGEIPPHLLQFSAVNRPVVVWNTTNRCNLHCKHCYINAENVDYNNELTTEEAKAMIDDLALLNIPVLLFSGGEPILRKDLIELAAYARDKGIRPVLSTNGTLIDEKKAIELKEAGFGYIGVSIDGAPSTHDHFRQKEGAFDMAIAGIHACQKAGLKTGVRFTITTENEQDLPALFDILEQEKIPRCCIYHLVYAGRGADMIKQDIKPKRMRELMNYIAQKTKEFHNKGVEVEILTTDNHADGIYLYNMIKEEHPDRANDVMDLLKMHGGCSAGVKFGNIDSKGNVHPCQFWQDYTIGNVKDKPFSVLWNSNDELLVKLREKEKYLRGNCGDCKYNKLCGGCRIRAKVAYKNIWAEDPACYLTSSEIYNPAVWEGTTEEDYMLKEIVGMLKSSESIKQRAEELTEQMKGMIDNVFDKVEREEAEKQKKQS